MEIRLELGRAIVYNRPSRGMPLRTQMMRGWNQIMSASREKKKRQEQYQTGELAKTPEKKSSFRPIHILYIVLAVLFVVAFVLLMMVNNGFFASRSPALSVGEHNVSASMYNFFYRSIYANYYSTYQDYIENYSYPFSASTPLSEQVYNNETGETWADYFDSRARDGMVWAYSLSDEAEKAGFTLSDEKKQEIETIITGLDSTASSYNYSSANGYLAAYYGTGCTTGLYREFLTLEYTATEYQTVVEDSYTYTEDELMAYYDEHKVDCDTVDYRTYFISGKAEGETVTDEETGEETTLDPTDEQTAAAMAAALDAADAMATATKGDEDAFVGYAYLVDSGLELESGKQYSDYVGDDYEDKTSSHKRTNYSTASSTLDAMAEWLFESDRASGDTIALSNDSGYYVVYFIGRNDNNYSTVNVRHILIKPGDVVDVTDDEGNVDEAATEAAKEAADSAAKTKAEELLDTYLAGDRTEDAFAELAKLNSADSNASEGGLYENVYQGQMVDTFNDWCYDPARQPGDTGIVETTYGYHVMYFVSSDGENYRDSLVEDALRSDDYDAWYESVSAAYPVTEHSFGMRFITK